MDLDEFNSDYSDIEGERTGLNRYFSVFASDKHVHCRVKDCKQTFTNWKSFNLKRHLQGRHASIHSKLYPEETELNLKLQISALEMKFAAIELVTVNGQPFSLLEASAIRRFGKDTLQQLREKGFYVNLNRRTISKEIDEISNEIIDIIKEEIKDRPFCLLLDTCTKGTLSVLSMNAQYMIDDELIVRSLGVIELTHRHTAALIARTVKNYIEQNFGVSIRQVKAVVTDNAQNMVLTRKLLNKLALGESIDQYEEVSEDEIDLSDNEREEEGVVGLSAEDELEIANIINNNAHFATLVSSAANEFAAYYGPIVTVNPISCSTHTIQLAIKDTFAVCDVASIISTVNNLSKLLRTQIVQLALKHMNIQVIKPHIRNVTRWNSDYMMVSVFFELFLTIQFGKFLVTRNHTDYFFKLRCKKTISLNDFNSQIFFQLKDFLRLRPHWDNIKEIDDDFLAIDDECWLRIEELVAVLEFPCLATKAMERRQFCYTDLYLWSKRISLKLDEIIADAPIFEFAATLKANLMEREKSLFKTPIFMAAKYLDPRFKLQLTQTETTIAIETLHELNKQIKWKPLASPAPGLNNIDRQIEAQLLGNIQVQQNDAQLRVELTLAMANYNAVRVTDINRDAISFWRENKQIYPQLYELAKVVFSIASSISETERTFSAFSYIYNARRMNLLPRNVTSILMVRLNKDLFEQIKDTKINAIKKKK